MIVVHLYYGIIKKSAQRHCTYAIALQYFGKEMYCCSVEHCV
jgi:hypothetical protein